MIADHAVVIRSPVTPASAMNLNYRGQTRYYYVRDYGTCVPRLSRLTRVIEGVREFSAFEQPSARR